MHDKNFNPWQEALIMQVLKQQIKVFFPNLPNHPLSLIDKNTEKIAEIGTHSSAFGVGKKSASKKPKNNDLLLKEKEFPSLLAQKGLQIKPVIGDGNCLFRAISDQLYDDEKYHSNIRKYCLDYIELEENFFRNYVVQGAIASRFKDYISKKRKDGVWGDDIEIQALSEIYMCPIEIYAYSNTPMRTFHETSNKNLGEPIRLSYHGQSHFNSIVKINANFSMNRGNEPFGVREEMAIRKAKIRKDQVNIEEKELRIVRVEFENKGNRDLETTLQESLVAFEDSIKKISVRTFENVNLIF